MTCEGVRVPFALGLEAVQRFISADGCSPTPRRFEVPPRDAAPLLSSGSPPVGALVACKGVAEEMRCP